MENITVFPDYVYISGNITHVEVAPYVPDWFKAVLIPALFICICVGGLTGNGIVLYVLLRCSGMKTAPDVYILNLTAADLLFMIGIPFLAYTYAIDRQWYLGEVMCKIIFSIDGMNMYTGIFLLTAMSVDRYLAVVHAIWSIKYRTVFVAKLVCGILWITSFLLTLPLWVYMTAIEVPDEYGNGSTTFCYVSWGVDGDTYMICSFIIGFAVPLAVICLCYIQILTFLARGTRPGRVGHGSSKLGRVGLIVILAVALFTICWLPFWVTQLLLLAPNYTPTSAYEFAWTLGFCFQYLNSALNPLVYTCVREDFRQNLTKICCGVKYAEASRERRMSKRLASRSGLTNEHGCKTHYQIDETGKTTTTMIVNLNSCSHL
ncbi:somatostatin receptor 1 [Saccoglossus kowalevskii]|uniref:Somatostatin receptor 1 n=1 Tax=Saccoglossus kowalevskii TaxID=10224 RepID=D1LXE5_SACKO|nr:somatostatin receptor 1 [Saccoglossus kowalevskii]ACY92651.1 somatostatin receptor 1 [Saccoglossus kowalevskii]